MGSKKPLHLFGTVKVCFKGSQAGANLQGGLKEGEFKSGRPTRRPLRIIQTVGANAQDEDKR